MSTAATRCHSVCPQFCRIGTGEPQLQYLVEMESNQRVILGCHDTRYFVKLNSRMVLALLQLTGRRRLQVFANSGLKVRLFLCNLSGPPSHVICVPSASGSRVYDYILSRLNSICHWLPHRTTRSRFPWMISSSAVMTTCPPTWRHWRTMMQRISAWFLGRWYKG